MDTHPNIASPATKQAPVVLQVLPSLGTGGVERGTVDIARALTEAGWQALVASSGGPMVREVQRTGALHVELPVESKNPLVMWRNVDRLARLIAEHKVDIVHARSRAPAWSALYAAKRAGAAFVTTFHGHYNAANPAKAYYNSVMARGRRVIAISDFIGDHVVRRYGADPAVVRVIPRGVDIDIFDPGAVSAERVIDVAESWRVPDDARVVMLPGRLTRWKGQSVLIEALARIDRKGIRCILVGDDQGRERYRMELEDRIKRLELESVVQIAGHCRDMAAAYMLADVVISASTDPEAFGRVIAEAQAMGRPVIATDHGAARETVLEGVSGWLVPPGDASALAAALREALALTPEQRAALAETAIAHVRGRYTRPRMCEATLAVYAELLAEAGQGG
ncbi:MAG: glycosyltransferase [Alphaproteobacteria bacterium]|nr:glycosyltransferase [Alphaproteobacteria bacterium]